MLCQANIIYLNGSLEMEIFSGFDFKKPLKKTLARSLQKTLSFGLQFGGMEPRSNRKPAYWVTENDPSSRHILLRLFCSHYV